jgi:hypothetical protein
MVLEKENIRSKRQIQKHKFQNNVKIRHDRLAHINYLQYMLRILSISNAIRIRNAQIYMN